MVSAQNESFFLWFPLTMSFLFLLTWVQLHSTHKDFIQAFREPPAWCTTGQLETRSHPEEKGVWVEKS